MKLNKSKVKFIASNHTYWIKDVQLHGITAMLDRYILGGKYEKLKEDEELKKVVEKKAAKGSLVHSQAQYVVDRKFKGIDSFLLTCEPEIDAFISLMNEKGIKFEKSEYLVSDNDYYASSIDIVDSENNLYDIKTTATLEKEYVRWQLSIYAFLFELQNPTKTAGRLFAVHLKGNKAALVEVDRVDSEEIVKMMNAYRNDEDYVSPYGTMGEGGDSLMVDYLDADDKIKIAEAQKKAILEQVKDKLDAIEKVIKEEKARKEEFRKTIVEKMKEKKAYNVRGNGWSVSRSMDTTEVCFNEEAFRSAKPKLWEQFAEERIVDGGIRVTRGKEK